MSDTPFNRQHNRDGLIVGLHTLGISRLDREKDLSGVRPEIPLRELTSGRRCHLKIAVTWPWAPAIVVAWNRISALAQAP
jgi:hypothetical protein